MNLEYYTRKMLEFALEDLQELVADGLNYVEAYDRIWNRYELSDEQAKHLANMYGAAK